MLVAHLEFDLSRRFSSSECDRLLAKADAKGMSIDDYLAFLCRKELEKRETTEAPAAAAK